MKWRSSYYEFKHDHHQGRHEIYYKDWGKGPVVTFSHGWPLSSDTWDGQMLFLAQHGFRVVAHDRRGHGRSSQACSGNDMDGYADDLAAVIEALDLKDVMTRGPLDRRRRSRPLHRAARHEACRQGGPHRRRAADHVEVRGQSGRAPDRGLRQHAERLDQGPLAVLQGLRDTVLRRQQAWCQGLPGHAGSVLALEHAGRPQERVRKHQGLL